MESKVDSGAGPPTGATGTYAAVIYFHGMGSQRRFEEVCRLIDSIDRFLRRSDGKGKSLGLLADINPRVEPARENSDETFTYIRTTFLPRGQEDQAVARRVRFYEVYWAPVMAGQKSPWRVFKWMFGQALRPWRTLRSPWRERQRLRRASLVALFERGAELPQGFEQLDFQTLIQLYDKFEGSEALRNYPNGLFKDFLDFLAKESSDRPDTVKRHQRLARIWLRAYRRSEFHNCYVLASAVLAMGLLGIVTLAMILALLQRFTQFAISAGLVDLASGTPPTWGTALTIAVALFSVIGLGKFFTDYMGDVEAWATYEETDEKHESRQKIIERGRETFAHVLGDIHCDRVVVVAHSLGASIAHDTLQTVARLNRAKNANGDPILGPVPLCKIEHFITLGSPIDKVEYFFESYRSSSHRYKRVVEALRGDVGDVPFSRNRKPYIHWINFWDDGDPVSGPVRSPASRSVFSQQIDNIHVASLSFPNPGASHLAYFDNHDVIGRVFEIIYRRAYSFRALPEREGEDRDWESAYLGPGSNRPGKRRGWTFLATALPWLALCALVVHFVNAEWGFWPFAPFAAVLMTLLGGFAFSRGRNVGILGSRGLNRGVGDV